MSKFFHRVERISEGLYELQDFCNNNEAEFIKCDELSRVLAKFRASLSGAIMDDDVVPFDTETPPLPRLASEDMRHGLTVLYPDEERALRVQKPGAAWQVEYPELLIMSHDGWPAGDSWFKEPITQVEYFERRSLSTTIPQSEE